MAIKNTYSAESWEKVYAAFQSINFSAYDYDTVKQSLIDYLKIYHKESFNDFIESSELIALLEIFAYVAEQMAYRGDILAHENFITTAQRKQSILKLAKLISYKAARNYPATGLVKLTSINVTEDITDSIGNQLAGQTILWNDPNNTNWKEQFLLAINHVLVNQFGQPDKTVQVGDVAMQLYTLNNAANSFINNVFNFTVDTGGESFQMEAVPSDLDDNGVFEKTPDASNKLSIVYSNDGLGDGSDFTGFLMFIKQGTLLRQELNFTASLPNRTVELSPINVNQIDVWMNKVDSTGTTLERWENIESLQDQNITYNTSKNRKKFEVETLELDRIKLIFGDGDFSDIPVGTFHVWVRQSLNRSVVINKNKIQNQAMAFTYRAIDGMSETCNLTFSLTSTLQNSSASETIEHIRQAAPASYYSQNRMVNGQDYNTFLLRDPSIIRLKTVNRTFAGQPKYIEWNDPSGQYENVKVFGDDARLEYRFVTNNIAVIASGRKIIDAIIEPIVKKQSIQSLLSFIYTTAEVNGISQYAKGAILPIRTKYIEDTRENIWKTIGGQNIYTSGNGATSSPNGKLMEKTLIQGALDSHWYGEPIEFVVISGTTYAKIDDPNLVTYADDKIWPPEIPRTIDGVTPYLPGDVGSLHQQVAFFQSFGLKYTPFSKFYGDGEFGFNGVANTLNIKKPISNVEVWTFVVNADKSSVTATSDKRGKLPALPISTSSSSLVHMSDIFGSTPIDFYVLQGATEFEANDSFIISLDPNTDAGTWNASLPLPQVYNVGTLEEVSGASYYQRKVNCTGYWDIIEGSSTGEETNLGFNADPDPLNKASWIFWIKSTRDAETDEISGFDVTYRELKTIVESPTTKFWYNESNPTIDSATGEIVQDSVKILRSNFPSDVQLAYDFEMDVLGVILDQNGEPDYHKLEAYPSSKYDRMNDNTVVPANQLMVASFLSSDEPLDYRYWVITSGMSENYLPNDDDYVDIRLLPEATYNQFYNWPIYSSIFTIEGVKYSRVKTRSPLDFMWKHFSPYTNMIDPSVTNINDAYVLTRGYYDNVISFLEGRIASMPTPPSQLELRTRYADLLQYKMISDTLILHPGTIKLLFGTLAAPELRGKFRIVQSPSATMSVERIKQECLSVIQQFFAIENWDFGDTFYATELLSAIHQRLSTEIASVVLVPTYSINSFGSLFTVNAGIIEILQSCATLDDVEIVESLTPAVLRQS